MIKVVVGGATGKLGRLVCEQILADPELELTAAVVSATGGNVGKELWPNIVAVSPDRLEEVLTDADVYVDLTTPQAASENVLRVPATGTNLVIGTTAIPQKVLDDLAKATADNGISVLVSANFALGVNLFWKACEMLASKLPDYDFEIIEMHHNQKKDAPSGTAIKAAEAVQRAAGPMELRHGREGVTGPRGKEIGVHAIRAGDIVGEHTLIIAGNMECLELTHRAISREAFARGCLESIRWIAGRKDGRMHGMNEVLGI
ncbi:MAG: 4-hydroxy-tetrahydrodipicolinate reductase [Candidatus Methanomethylophilaceae archaeon]|nr:4-hydroxy-tetrahydrodipicolinate reductase [Candidatus Methanomethylophilaceae archaeon]MDI3541552.1 4-hydroxy-tetrahydrodipicolinate reductase [Candidatus Methanomethylophilaceae archaeon]HIJ00457.1 4-hydroxy-tetrahydrodipicolinate reductase [Candidatus Methanomethylophilaceae archaeon]